MKKHVLLSGFLMVLSMVTAQELYYPPTDGEWESVDPETLGMIPDQIDSLYGFLERTDTRGFLLLQDGKIVLERYFYDFHQDSVWYWASAGKSLAAALVGIAQSNDLLDIEDATSDYLGAGWTSLLPQQEDAILIRHQLSMATGLDDGIDPSAELPDPLNCLEPDCLQYLAEPGTRWAYHNAPYRLVQDVLVQAAGQNINRYTTMNLWRKIGGGGAWINYVHWSTPRSMARFGLFMLGKGKWDGEQIITDEEYFNNMINPSQELNKSYGYLWWLNGQESHMLPRIRAVLEESLMPAVPDDAYAGLGKNDQKIYVIPSRNQVIVRVGDPGREGGLAPTSYDRELWEYINGLYAITAIDEPALHASNEPQTRLINNGTIISDISDAASYALINQNGQVIQSEVGTGPLIIDISKNATGYYYLIVTKVNGQKELERYYTQ